MTSDGRAPFPTAWARRAVSQAVRAQVQRTMLKPLLWSVTRPAVHGLDRLAALRGPGVFAANHASHLDAPLILCSLPGRVAERTAVGAAADYFFDVAWRAVTTALVFNAFPVERHGTSRNAGPALDLLADGWNLLLFPEGSRTDDGQLNRFRLGAAHCCVTAGVWAVPVAVHGTYQAMPRGTAWPRTGRPRVSVRFGSPLRPAPGEQVREFNARLEAAVARLRAEHEAGWWRSISEPVPVVPPRAEAAGTRPAWLGRWEASGGPPGRRSAEQEVPGE